MGGIDRSSIVIEMKVGDESSGKKNIKMQN